MMEATQATQDSDMGAATQAPDMGAATPDSDMGAATQAPGMGFEATSPEALHMPSSPEAEEGIVEDVIEKGAEEISQKIFEDAAMEPMPPAIPISAEVFYHFSLL